MGHTLGKGAYGKVYKGKLKLNPDLRIEVSKKFWIVTLPQSVTVSQYFEMIPSEKLVGRLRWRRAREAPAPKTWKGRLAFSWNFQRGKFTKLFLFRCDPNFQALKHCELDGSVLANWGRYAPNAVVGALWGDHSFWLRPVKNLNSSFSKFSGKPGEAASEEQGQFFTHGYKTFEGKVYSFHWHQLSSKILAIDSNIFFCHIWSKFWISFIFCYP